MVAVKEVSRLPDHQILAAFRKNGYVDNQGMQTHRWHQAARDCGLILERVKEVKVAWQDVTRKNYWGEEYRSTRMVGYSLATIRDTYTEGTYLVGIDSHALVLRNGRIVDPNMKRGMTRSVVCDLTRVVNAPEIPEPSDYLSCRVAFGPLRGRSGAFYDRRLAARDYEFSKREVCVKTKTYIYTTLLDILENTPYTFADFLTEYKSGNARIVNGT